MGYFNGIGNTSMLALYDSAESAVSQNFFDLISVVEPFAFYVLVMGDAMPPLGRRGSR